jgi:hypothetical protein
MINIAEVQPSITSLTLDMKIFYSFRADYLYYFFQRILLSCFIFFQYSNSNAQPNTYTAANAHAHNDYQQALPFSMAYQEGFGSMEADVFLVNGRLLVAHTPAEIDTQKTLESLYLLPISQKIRENKGSVFTDKLRSLQLLIDIKSNAIATLDALIVLLKKYPAITHNKKIRIVISGNRPEESEYSSYPPFVYFDGRLNKGYEKQTLKKIALLSDDFTRYSKWKGTGPLPEEDKELLIRLISQAHHLKKPVRFWASPDNPESWQQLISLGIDFINTDRITDLSFYLQSPIAFKKEALLDQITLHNDSMVIMPFNRIIRSAGTVIRFGDPVLENHALDIAALPGEKQVVVEDRYGVFILDLISKQITQRWSYKDHFPMSGYMSTYSGIKVFKDQGKTWVAWSAAERSSGQAAVMLAEWDGLLKNLNQIPVAKRAPATNAIPNDLLINRENGELYLYVVLNGNDQLQKYRWSTKELVWETETGLAPYGISYANGKIYVTNWAGTKATDSTRERAGIPWGLVYTDPRTGATSSGTVSIIDPASGKQLKEIETGLHPNAIIAGNDERFLYISNGSSDDIAVIDTRKDNITEKIRIGLIQNINQYSGSSPNALALSKDQSILYISNGLDNAIAVVQLGKKAAAAGTGKSMVKGFIPTETYPAGLIMLNDQLVVCNLESDGADVIQQTKNARSIHQQLGSVSIIPLPDDEQLIKYTAAVFEMNQVSRIAQYEQAPRKNMPAVPVPARLGEPSVFKHVVYIIKENKTYDQVFGDLPGGRGDSTLCIFGNRITPNIHALAKQFGWMDNYYASGKSSAEGHQWTDAAIVSDYVEKNVRAWYRSYPHRQEDALVYNKSGFIWNQVLDHGKTVRIYGEACKTLYDEKKNWSDFYQSYNNSGNAPDWKNTSTIARILPVISPTFPDCDNMVFNDQIRADEFLKEWKQYEANANLPNLMVLSLPNDHSAGTSPGFPTPNAMVADNDLALGRIVDAITKSKYWDSTVIFITQDDSQGGWDHISAYRTVGLVVSPYSTGKLITTNYNQTSMVRTIEQILGVPPMNIIDATAKPMFDCFSEKKQQGTFTHLKNNVPLDEMNKPLSSLRGKAKKFALQSLHEVYNEVDGGADDEMNRIIWFFAKGNQPYPSGK